jgi:hypothetical protein
VQFKEVFSRVGEEGLELESLYLKGWLYRQLISFRKETLSDHKAEQLRSVGVNLR